MQDRSYRWLFLTLALVGLSLDQVSKYGVFGWLYKNGEGETHQVAPGVVEMEFRWKVVPNVFDLLAQFTTGRETGTGPLAWLRTLSGEVMPKVNQGALFGFLNHHKELANALFAVVSLLAAVGISWWAWRTAAARDRSLMVSLGLILAGTLGNLYDRVVFTGVRDFLHVRYQGVFDWPVFNVADCCLVCGAFLLLVQAFLRKPAPADEPTPAPAKMAEAR